MNWFLYHQNNSGGVFHEPAISVYIHAEDEEQANEIAERVGLYFNGCDIGWDCECCGDRWYFPEDCGEEMPNGIMDEMYIEWAKESDIPVSIFFDSNGKEIKRI